MKKAVTLVILGILFSVIMVGAPATAAQTRTTFGVGFSFVPSLMVADSGDTIELNNVLAGPITPHSFTTDASICLGYDPLTNQPIAEPCDLDSKFFSNPNGSGTTPLWTSIAPGAYRFYCVYHVSLGMEGTIFIDIP